MPGSFIELKSSSTNLVSQVVTNTETLARWWTTFEDPELDSLIRRALERNRDLRLALSRVREARAQRGVVASGLFPEIDFTAAYNRSRGSKNVEIPLGALGGGSGAPTTSGLKTKTLDPPSPGKLAATSAPQPGGPLGPFGKGGLPGVTTELFQAGFDSSWEIDIFGGTRRAIQAANAEISAAIEDRRSVLVSLLGDVATAYVQLRSSQKRLEIARENLELQHKTLAIVEAKFKAGFATDLEVEQQSAQVAITAGTIPALESSERSARHTLSFLLGEPPGTLSAELAPHTPLPDVPPQVPVGVPSDLLRRRPDIREAERRLAGATAQIGVARADLFPRFNLTSAFGLDSTKPRNFFDWQSRYFAINPGVSWPLLDWGRVRSNIKVQNERQQQAMIAFENTVQRALKDVEDALTGFQEEQLRREAFSKATLHSRAAFQIARQKYETGLVDFLTVLQTQQSLFAAEDALIQSDAAIRTSLISLYKALGGGWQ